MIQELALENFQLGRRDDIQTIVRSRNYKTLTAAISGAIAKKKFKESLSRTNNKTKEQDQFRQGRNTGLKMWQDEPRTRLPNKSLRQQIRIAKKPVGVTTPLKNTVINKILIVRRQDTNEKTIGH